MTFGSMDILAGAEFPAHLHDVVQITFVIEGTLEFTIGGETRIMERGMMAVVPPGIPHSARAMTDCRVYDCFNPERGDYPV